MSSLRALMLHHVSSAKSVLASSLWRESLLSVVWPGIAIVLKIIALSSREVTPTSCLNRRAVVLTGVEDSFILGRVPGQDLSALSSRWLEETLGFTDLHWTSSLDSISQNEAPDITLVTYDWLLENKQRPIRNAFRLAWQLRRLHSPAFVMLPDGFWLQITALGSLIVALAGGSQVLLQDSQDAHRKFGTVRPTGPHFWTWPPSHVDAWKSRIPWREREKLALIPGTGGGPYREWVALQIERELTAAAYRTTRTRFHLSWDSYVELNRKSRIVVTTCKMQPDYLRGPRYYRKLIPHLTVTGRVWEAFASGNLLITDENPILEQLGFKAGRHYLPLPSPSETAWADWELPTDRILATIANKGNQQFLACVNSRLRPEFSNGPHGT